MNMRSRSAANFTAGDLLEIVRSVHSEGIRAYLAVNTVVYDDELASMRELIDSARAAGVDAVIAADQAVILYAHSVGMSVHISTQLNVSNFETLKFYARWADTVVLAREVTLRQVRAIYDRIAAEDVRGPGGELVKIEMFAHGALCMAVSGKCYLSLHDCGESANRGACLQLCRRAYALRDLETGEEIATEGPWLLSPKDLCTLPFLDNMLEAGVRVLKIEGRARPAEYVKRVVEVYDEAVGACLEGDFSAARVEDWTERLSAVFNRGFWEGYYLGARVPELSRNYGSSATVRKVYVGKVTNFFKKIGVAEILVEASPFPCGSEYLITGTTTGVVEGIADEIRVAESPAEVAPQGIYFSLKTPQEVHRGDKVYKIESLN
jgi:putative protease